MNNFKFEGSIPNSIDKPNPLKSEHLKEGIKPIMVCVGTPKCFINNQSVKEEAYETAETVPDEIHNVDYKGCPIKLKKENFKNNGKNSYVISPVDSSDKFSKAFRNCTGLLLAGKDKNTNEDISLLSHQDPGYFLTAYIYRDNFKKDLIERLEEMKKKSADGTIDALILGGNYFEDNFKYRKQYLDSVKFLSEEVSAIFGFEPIAITGPKNIDGDDDVFYENKSRKLYIIRPVTGDRTTEAYLPSEIKEKEASWKN